MMGEAAGKLGNGNQQQQPNVNLTLQNLVAIPQVNSRGEITDMDRGYGSEEDTYSVDPSKWNFSDKGDDPIDSMED